jgi:glutamate synthase domain-containing protein 3
VLDIDGMFSARCNPSMVDLDALGDEDANIVRTLIHRHYECTASAVAWRVLSGWREWSRRMVKVTPREYRNAVAARRRSPEGSAAATS